MTGCDIHSICFRRNRADMGIYDREYYRGETRGSAWWSGATPVLNALIAINVAIFVFQNLAKLRPEGEFITTWFAASVEETFRHHKLWQLLTATFFHANIMHLVQNMLFFWFVAREMEPLYGSRDFLAFYVCAGMFSTLAWLLFAFAQDERAPVIGASGAVTAVGMLFTLYYPKREMLLVVIPMPMWMLMGLFLVIDLFTAVTGTNRTVAVEAHLAGAGSAFLFKQFDLRLSRLVPGRLSRPRLRIFTPIPREPSRSRSSSPSRSAASIGGGPKSPSVSVLPEEQLDARLDEVLAKIAREGRSGLTEEELRVLQEASRRARIKRSDRP
jgi:membrane associated rhomboid family serine protease